MLKQGQSIAEQDRLSARRIQHLMENAFLAPLITRQITQSRDSREYARKFGLPPRQERTLVAAE
ncbi:MAG: hypothetical protein V2I51_17030 [Anderseniella sp.]|jgi:hypothetical protein|nr:hypothetical protein [Anderseniella sp.]